MNKDEYVNHYDAHYIKMGESGAGQLVWEPQYEIWKKAGYEPGMSVLDYGCGVGVMVECGIKPEDYNGVDISLVALELARKRYPNYNFVHFEMGKLIGLPSKVCVAQSVFTHTPFAYVDICLEDIKRNFTKFAIIDILIGPDNPLDEHVRHFTETQWLDALWRNKLKGEKLGEHNFVGYNHHYYKVTNER